MEEAQAPEETIEAVEEVATLETEEVVEAETLEEDTPEASTESTTETTAEDNKSGYERRQKFKAQRDRADLAEKELQHLKEQMYRNQQSQQPAQPTPPLTQQVQGDPKAPNIDHYDDTNQYIRDTMAYERKAIEVKQSQEKQVEGFNALEKEYIANNKTYLDDVLVNDIKPTPIIAQEILRSQLGPQLLHAFSKDPQLAMRLNSLHPSDAIRELIKLEEKVKLTPAVSSAPAPISTSKTSMPTGSKKYSEGQSQRDYATEREAYIASKRR